MTACGNSLEPGTVATPPYFAGRKDVIADIEDTCRTMWKNHQAGVTQYKGMTRIIHGAPGVGKTALLGHLASGMAAGNTRIVNMPGPDSLENGDEIATLIAETLKPGLGKTVGQHYNRHVQHSREVSDPPAAGPCQIGAGSSPSEEVAKFGGTGN